VLNREVAVNVVQTPSAYLARRFEDEATITGRLHHPGIPPVYDLHTLADGRPFLAMNLINRQTLQDILASRERERPGDAGAVAARARAQGGRSRRRSAGRRSGRRPARCGTPAGWSRSGSPAS
jgi:serine/threonine protein kinase